MAYFLFCLWFIKEVHYHVGIFLSTQHSSVRGYRTYSSIKPNCVSQGPLWPLWYPTELMYKANSTRTEFPSLTNDVDGFQPDNLSWFAEKGRWVVKSVISVSHSLTACYFGNPCANAVFFAIYQGGGCHTTIPCVIIKQIETQMQLL